MTSFDGYDWFQHYFGFKEKPAAVMKNIFAEDFEDHSEITSNLNGRKIKCGKFSLRDMNSYKHIFDLLRSKQSQDGHLHVIHGHGYKSKNMDLVHIIRHQNNEDFNGATFVAASNFNLLEYGSSNATASNGISQYAVDSTQGPAFATATIGSTVYRTYFVKHQKINSTLNNVKNPNSNSNYFIDYKNQEDASKNEIVVGQLNYELNLLERTPIPVVHGKAILNSSTQKISNSDFFNNFDFTNENNYEIAVIQNAEVTTNINNDGVYFDANPNQFVHQIFAASFDLSDYVTKNEKNLEIMENILFYEYRMTILQAIENSITFPGSKGSNKLVLPLIGAGFFRNPIKIVTDCIKKNKDLIISSGIDVYIVCFNDQSFNDVFPLLEETVKETNGTVIDT